MTAQTLKSAALTLTLLFAFSAQCSAQSVIGNAFKEIKEAISPTQVSVLEASFTKPASVQSFLNANKEIVFTKFVGKKGFWSARIDEKKPIANIYVKKAKYEYSNYHYRRASAKVETVHDYMYDITVTFADNSQITSTKKLNEDTILRVFNKTISLAGADKISMNKRQKMYRESGYREVKITPRNKAFAANINKN